MLTHPNGPTPELDILGPDLSPEGEARAYYAMRLRKIAEQLAKPFALPRYARSAEDRAYAIGADKKARAKACAELAWIKAKYPDLEPSKSRGGGNDPLLQAIFG